MNEAQDIHALEQKIKALEEQLAFYEAKSKERDCALAAFGRAINALAATGPKHQEAVELFIAAFLAGLNEYKMSLEEAKEATQEALASSTTLQ